MDVCQLGMSAGECPTRSLVSFHLGSRVRPKKRDWLPCARVSVPLARVHVAGILARTLDAWPRDGGGHVLNTATRTRLLAEILPGQTAKLTS